MFEFVFQGSYGQYSFFDMVVREKCPKAQLTLISIDGERDHNCCIVDDPRTCFEVGMILSACYSKYEHLQNTFFQPNLTEDNG